MNGSGDLKKECRGAGGESTRPRVQAWHPVFPYQNGLVQRYLTHFTATIYTIAVLSNSRVVRAELWYPCNTDDVDLRASRDRELSRQRSAICGFARRSTVRRHD